MSPLEAVFAFFGEGLRTIAAIVDPVSAEPLAGNDDFEPARQTPRAVGLQHADAPGEVSDGFLATAPSPGDLTDSDLLYELAGALFVFARDAHDRIPALIDAARDRAAQFLAIESEPDASVSHEDLAAHITAIWTSCIERTPRIRFHGVCDEIVRDLLAEYRITK
ncbi:hypothetical protein A5784_34905 [Mycobacterium sp. 852013-50091_SCH5140682]|uniref:hypothetical protein n=1 Tax=Mycobacterium sp. 852013-50091_SCH5140682 TaxID=1834109 RepID=UPI0007EB2FC8|nr:hypothetical protein [Mycobacterium sp. 852013-50091_SCH5140682]OBC11390.1 hypothetical protein A5784_34905 [Mycobacterium sp. 852013-50091_SCH5140682]